MPLISATITQSQIHAVNTLIAQVNTQIASLQQQEAIAKQSLAQLEAQLANLQNMESALGVIDAVTQTQFNWTQDQSGNWTGTLVAYPDQVQSHIAVSGGNGPFPVLQSSVGP